MSLPSKVCAFWNGLWKRNKKTKQAVNMTAEKTPVTTKSIVNNTPPKIISTKMHKKDIIKDFIVSETSLVNLPPPIIRTSPISKDTPVEDLPKYIPTSYNSQKENIYLIKTKENISNNKNVYTIGTSVINLPKSGLKPHRYDTNKIVADDTVDSVTKITPYGKGAELISIRQCINAKILETDIITELTKKFIKIDEKSFQGDPYDIDDIIEDLVIQEKNTNLMI